MTWSCKICWGSVTQLCNNHIKVVCTLQIMTWNVIGWNLSQICHEIEPQLPKWYKSCCTGTRTFYQYNGKTVLPVFTSVPWYKLPTLILSSGLKNSLRLTSYPTSTERDREARGQTLPFMQFRYEYHGQNNHIYQFTGSPVTNSLP